MLYKYLYNLFDESFIYNSYSCRLNKGTHKAVKRLEKFTRIVSKNYSQYCWALKLDIKKFFASINHKILIGFLENKIANKNILWLINEIISSFHSELGVGKGIPLGNLTSQIFANIYLNELDQCVKHKLKMKYYLRYADDFLVLSRDNESRSRLVVTIERFLATVIVIRLCKS